FFMSPMCRWTGSSATTHSTFVLRRIHSWSSFRSKAKSVIAYKVHTRHVSRFSAGLSFLAGDSAHIHTPAGAQGMNTGIQDGYNLAWKLALVIRGKAGENYCKPITKSGWKMPNIC